MYFVKEPENKHSCGFPVLFLPGIKKIKFFLKKVLTNGEKCSMIYKSPDERAARESSEKLFKKVLKKPLTSVDECDIIIKLSKESRRL